VNSSSTFRWLLAAVLVVSVVWKTATRLGIETDPKDHLIVEFLKRNHFDVSPTEQIANDVPMIRAQTASCRLQIVQLAPNGSDRDLFRHLAAGADRAFMVFRGKVYAQQPIFWTVLDDFLFRHLRELGLTKRVIPIIAVATNSSCDAERIPWNELRIGTSQDRYISPTLR
jgi:hypothetical protein